MRIKKYIIAYVLITALCFSHRVYAQNPYEKVGCCGWMILAPLMFFYGVKDSISKGIDNSRTTTVYVAGVKAVFKQNTVVENDRKKGAILKGELLEEIKVNIRGRSVVILPGEVRFYESGNIRQCHISRSELYIGDNSTVQCMNLTEFYDDQYVKRTVIAGEQPVNSGTEPTGEGMRYYTVQGKQINLSGVVSFYNDGKVEEFKLSGDETFSVADYTVKFSEDTVLNFSSNGSVIYIKPQGEHAIKIKFKDKDLAFANDIFLHENGTIKTCILSEPLIIHNGMHKLRVRERYPSMIMK